MRTARSPDEDITKIFVKRLEADIKRIYDQFRFAKDMIMNKSDKINYKNATHCNICESELGNDKVRDHCHLTGKYRGAAHKKCNLEFKVPKFFPVIFHNLSSSRKVTVLAQRAWSKTGLRLQVCRIPKCDPTSLKECYYTSKNSSCQIKTKLSKSSAPLPRSVR